MIRAASIVSVVVSGIVFFGTFEAASEVAGNEVPYPGPGDEVASVSGGSWSLEEIAGDIGDFSYVAVAVDSSTGDVFIAYYVSGAVLKMPCSEVRDFSWQCCADRERCTCRACHFPD